MCKKLIVSLASLISLISLIAFIALSCAPSADIGSKREEIAGSISYVDIIGAVGSSISPSLSSNIIPVTATVEYSIVPELPAGLRLIKNTGEIEGTPEAMSDSTSYRVRASGIDNYMGEIVSESFSITIRSSLLDLMDISNSSIGYDNTTGTVGTSLIISPSKNIFPSTAADNVEYSIEPTTLPVGLNFDPKTGEIAGTPLAESAPTDNTNYRVRVIATDPFTGSVESDPFTIAIVGEKSIIRSTLNYLDTTGTIGEDLLITPTSTIPSDADVEYFINPLVLPVGLSFIESTGVIEGRPRTVFSQTTFQVRAMATAPYTGMVESNEFTIVVKIPITGSVSYEAIVGLAGSEFSASPSTDFVPDTATVEYSIDPELPAGLMLIKNTGDIAGFPNAVSASTSYVVSASGTDDYIGKIDSDPFTIEVTETTLTLITGMLTYADSSTRAGTPLSLAPTSTIIPSDASVTYSIKKPAPLPNGVTFTLGTGVISVSESTVLVETTFQVTATGTGDYAGIVESDEFNIEVSRIPTMGTLSYASFEGSPGDSISLSPTLVIDQAEASVTYSISSDYNLPNGLTLSDAGIISGSVNATVDVTLKVTATANGIYSGTVVSNEFTIKVQAISGSYAYPSSTSSTRIEIDVDEYVSIPISRNSIVVPSGSGALQYVEHNDTLPEGLSVNRKTGAIEGTPTEATTGVEGRVTKVFRTGYPDIFVFSEIFHIKINGIRIGGSVGYRVYNFSGAINSTFRSDLISFIEPSGATVRYEKQSNLPDGLEVDPITGTIFGRPTVLTTGEFDRAIKAVGTGKYQGTVYSNAFKITITEPVPLTGGLSYPYHRGTSFYFTNDITSVKPNLTGNLAAAAAAGVIRYSIAGMDGWPVLGEGYFEGVAFNPYTGEIRKDNSRNILGNNSPFFNFVVTATGIGKYTGSKTVTIVMARLRYLD